MIQFRGASLMALILICALIGGMAQFIIIMSQHFINYVFLLIIVLAVCIECIEEK